VSILPRRLLCNRLSTKANLVARGILTQDARFCVTGCGEEETTQYLFLNCPLVKDLWNLVRDWVGISAADPYFIYNYFVQFTFSTSGSTLR